MSTEAPAQRPPASLSEKGCLAVVADLKRAERRNSARQARHLARAAELAAPGQASRQNAAPYEMLDGPQLVGAEIALTLAMSPSSAIRLVNDAVAICSTLEDLLRVVEDGKLDWYTLVRIHDRMSDALSPGTPTWDNVQRTLHHELSTRPRTHGAALGAADRAIAAADPVQAAERGRRARKDRHITIFPEADGMAGLTGRLRADDAYMADAVLDTLADACRDQADRAGTPDPRTHQQRRADALTGILNSIHRQTPVPVIPKDLSGQPFPSPRQPEKEAPGRKNPPRSRRTGTSTPGKDHTPSSNPDIPPVSSPSADEASVPPSRSDNTSDPTQATPPTPGPGSAPPSDRVLAWWRPPPLPTRKGRRPHLVVTISTTTLLGLDDLPGTLQGYGTVPADLARELASQAGRITLLPETPAHGPGDQANCAETSHRYRPCRSTTDKILARFQECVHPGCTRPATRCDLDHAVPYAQAGPTCECNLVPQCRFHHRLKTHAGWKLRLTRPDEPYPTGTVEWKSRLGQRHIEPPPPHPGLPRAQPPPTTEPPDTPAPKHVSPLTGASTAPTQPLGPAVRASLSSRRIPLPRALPHDPASPEDTMDQTTRARRRERKWSRMPRLLEPPPATTDFGEPPF